MVMDTSTFTHFCRAGYGHILQALAPQVWCSSRVKSNWKSMQLEICVGVPTVGSTTWAGRIFPTSDEEWTAMQVKVVLGGGTKEHMGECAVIACAKHRKLVAVIDERAAVAETIARKVPFLDTMRLVANAHKSIFDQDESKTVALVDALLGTGMWLPVKSGSELFG